MNVKRVILLGLLASLLLIFLCVNTHVDDFYKKFKLEKLDKNSVVDIENREKADKKADKIVATRSNDLEKIAPEKPEDRVAEETILKEEHSTFTYIVDKNQRYMSGELPLLEEGDELKGFISQCIKDSACENNITFVNSGENVSWKPLVLSLIGLFDKIEIENPKILIDKDSIKIEGVFKDMESKGHLSTLLIDFKTYQKMYDMTTIAVKDKPLYRILKDVKEEVETPKDKTTFKESVSSISNDKNNIYEVQDKVARLLQNKRINFEKNSDHITVEGKKILDEILASLTEPESILLDIQGYTDVGGDKNFNFNISLLRATAVKNYFIEKGLNSENIVAKGFGESKLLLPDSPYSILNRRVEIYLKRKK